MKVKARTTAGRLIRVGFYASAIALGISIALWQMDLLDKLSNPVVGQLKLFTAAPAEPARLERDQPASTILVKEREQTSSTTTTATTVPESQHSQVYVANGLRLQRWFDEDQRFLGYQVTEASPDHHFREGDVITSINGLPLEDSAAGSELLIIALNTGSAEVGLKRM